MIERAELETIIKRCDLEISDAEVQKKLDEEESRSREMLGEEIMQFLRNLDTVLGVVTGIIVLWPFIKKRINELPKQNDESIESLRIELLRDFAPDGTKFPGKVKKIIDESINYAKANIEKLRVTSVSDGDK